MLPVTQGGQSDSCSYPVWDIHTLGHMMTQTKYLYDVYLEAL